MRFLSFLLLVWFWSPSYSFVWHVIEGEGWPWSDLVHAYPQNERTVLFAFLTTSLFPPFHTLGGEGGFVYTRLMGVLFFLLSLPIRAEQLHYRRFWSGLDGTTQGCMF